MASMQVGGVQSVGGATGASAPVQTQAAPQVQGGGSASATQDLAPQGRASADTFRLSDEAAEESDGGRPTPRVGWSDSQDDKKAEGASDDKKADGASGDKSAQEAEAKKRAEEEAKKKEIEELQKKIDELEQKLDEQKKAGDEKGAQQTQNELDSARAQLKHLTEPPPSATASPQQATQGASAPQGGAAPVQAAQGPAGAQPAFSQGAPGGAASSGSPTGTTARPGANAQPISPEDLKKGTPMGQALAQEALKHATDGTGDGQHCFGFVGDDLRKFGINTSGASAYMAADQLAQSDKMKEVSGVSQDDLKKLPPGAVVVWDRGNGNEHGHVSIALGDGREASDIIRQQVTNHGTAYRVFLPNDG